MRNQFNITWTFLKRMCFFPQHEEMVPIPKKKQTVIRFLHEHYRDSSAIP